MVDRYRWINKSGRTRAQETYLSLGRVTVSHIAPCVASHHISGPLSHQPCFHSQLSIGTTKRIFSRNVLLGFNWNLSGSSYCIQGWRLPSEIWWWALCNKEQRLTQEFCLIANICAAEWAIPVQQDNGHNYKSLQTEPLSSLSDKMSKNVVMQ